jgi:hypothetical protein
MADATNTGAGLTPAYRLRGLVLTVTFPRSPLLPARSGWTLWASGTLGPVRGGAAHANNLSEFLRRSFLMTKRG